MKRVRKSVQLHRLHVTVMDGRNKLYIQQIPPHTLICIRSAYSTLSWTKINENRALETSEIIT